ncbi:MAG: glycine/betaine transporter permease [Vampirovibrio sp.]|jgi:osmoprotectant transport system permease protein|nr:glycine/betaine transporter permease [Vampirovibrio sp.]
MLNTEWITLIIQEVASHRLLLREAMATHLGLTVAAWCIAALMGLLLGYGSFRSARIGRIVPPVFNTLRVIPGLALIAFMIPVLGTGAIPTIVALCLLALPSVMLNALAGFRQVDAPVLESAQALGLDAWQVFSRVELPLALPYILTGLRIAGVEIIAGATLAAFIGGGGLGTLIVKGLSTYNFPLVLAGALPVALLALLVEFGFNELIRQVTRYQAC